MQHTNFKLLLSLVDHDLDLLTSLIELFCRDWPRLIEQMQQSLLAGDNSRVEACVHRLYGQLKNFFANDLASLAAEIEEKARENSLQELSPRVTELASGLEEVEQELTHLVERLGEE